MNLVKKPKIRAMGVFTCINEIVENLIDTAKEDWKRNKKDVDHLYVYINYLDKWRDKYRNKELFLEDFITELGDLNGKDETDYS